MNKLIVALLLIIPGFVSGQVSYKTQAATDFAAVNAAYRNSSSLKLDVDYTLFPSYTSVTPFEKSKGVYMKQGSNTYSNLLGIISLSNSKMTVTLDSNEQTIVVTDPVSKKNEDPSAVNLDTLLNICSSIEYKELPEGLKFYKLHFDRVPVFEYNAIEVYIDSKTNFISRLTMYFRIEMDMDESDDVFTKQKPRLEIVYSNVNTKAVFDANQFSETRYVTVQGKLVSAAAPYSKFRLINNRIR